MTIIQTIKFEFRKSETLPEAIQKEIDELDTLAYKDSAGNPEIGKIEWASSQWMSLGRLDGRLVTQLCCLKREITINNRPYWVTGVGGVATHPQYQRKGYAKALLLETEKFIRTELNTPFALLLCDGMPCDLYRSLGWQDVADHIIYQQDGNPHRFESNVMIFQFMDMLFPKGEIDLCGSPW